MKFIIDCLRGIEKLKSGHWFHQLRRIALDVDPEAKETVDHILNGAFVSFYVGRKWEAIEEMEKLPIAWFIGDKFWKWKMYIDHWITEKTQFLDRSLHDKFELFVYTRITSILNMYLSPKDQRRWMCKSINERLVHHRQERIRKKLQQKNHPAARPGANLSPTLTLDLYQASGLQKYKVLLKLRHSWQEQGLTREQPAILYPAGQVGQGRCVAQLTTVQFEDKFVFTPMGRGAV